MASPDDDGEKNTYDGVRFDGGGMSTERPSAAAGFVTAVGPGLGGVERQTGTTGSSTVHEPAYIIPLDVVTARNENLANARLLFNDEVLKKLNATQKELSDFVDGPEGRASGGEIRMAVRNVKDGIGDLLKNRSFIQNKLRINTDQTYSPDELNVLKRGLSVLTGNAAPGLSVCLTLVRDFVQSLDTTIKLSAVTSQLAMNKCTTNELRQLRLMPNEMTAIKQLDIPRLKEEHVQLTTQMRALPLPGIGTRPLLTMAAEPVAPTAGNAEGAAAGPHTAQLEERKGGRRTKELAVSFLRERGLGGVIDPTLLVDFVRFAREQNKGRGPASE